MVKLKWRFIFSWDWKDEGDAKRDRMPFPLSPISPKRACSQASWRFQQQKRRAACLLVGEGLGLL